MFDDDDDDADHPRFAESMQFGTNISLVTFSSELLATQQFLFRM